MDSTECVTIDEPETSCALKLPFATHEFTFDRIFGSSCEQPSVFDHIGRPIVENLFKGLNGTIIAYGQTGSGKTYSMMGPDDNHTGFCDDNNTKGLIPRMVSNIFDGVQNADSNLKFTLTVQYCEIYKEKIKDLLDPDQDNLKIKEDKEGGRGLYIEGCTEEAVTTAKQVFDLMKFGAAKRATSSTRMNDKSSRSHSIFIVSITQKNLIELDTKCGKLFLVDLAGSEKVKKTRAEGKVLEEAKTINKSLSCLGNVINALTDGKSKFVPYRDSKLTRLLQDSLGGNSLTTLLINCSPSSYNEQETLSTLRFGTRAKNIKNKPRVNQIMSAVELMRQLEISKRENAALLEELEMYRSKGSKKHIVHSEMVANKQELDSLREQCEDLEKRVEIERELKEKAKQESVVLAERNTELESRVNYLQEVEQELTTYLADVRSMSKNSAEEIQRLRDELADKDTVIKHLQHQTQKLEREHDKRHLRVKSTKEQLAGMIDQFRAKLSLLEDRTTSSMDDTTESLCSDVAGEN
jgi:kinesin family protein 5